MIVMKFGGTSVADADAISRLTASVGRAFEGQAAASRPGVAVVVSALSKVTDRLIEAARLARDGQADSAARLLEELLERHVSVASEVTSARRDELVASVCAEFAELIGLVHALAVLREVSPRSMDAVVATGEVVSSRIAEAALADAGLPSVWVDARQVLVTDAEHTGAIPQMDATRARTLERVAPVVARGAVPVLGGFIGATSDGITTTLGRGGSDYSAAIIGACLDADEIQIWTDVDGMLTADPRVVRRPRLVPELSFAEASELAYFGAKVLHPSTILPAVAQSIPVRILNSRRPEVAGTRITARPGAANVPLTALSCKRGVTVVNITSSRMLMAHGFLRRLFEVFERFKTPVDVVTTSEVSVSVTVDDGRRLDEVVKALGAFAEVSTEEEMAIVCAVGENLQSDPTVFAQALVALGDIPLRLVSQAGSRRNVTFVLRDSDLPVAMQRLHDRFFAQETT